MTVRPEGVIARYLTVGGATVDITDDSDQGWVTARCQGCTWTGRRLTDHTVDDTAEQIAVRIDAALPAVRELAQQHAETCRAEAKPDISS